MAFNFRSWKHPPPSGSFPWIKYPKRCTKSSTLILHGNKINCRSTANSFTFSQPYQHLRIFSFKSISWCWCSFVKMCLTLPNFFHKMGVLLSLDCLLFPNRYWLGHFAIPKQMLRNICQGLKIDQCISLGKHAILLQYFMQQFGNNVTIAYLRIINLRFKFFRFDHDKHVFHAFSTGISSGNRRREFMERTTLNLASNETAWLEIIQNQGLIYVELIYEEI